MNCDLFIKLVQQIFPTASIVDGYRTIAQDAVTIIFKPKDPRADGLGIKIMGDDCLKITSAAFSNLTDNNIKFNREVKSVRMVIDMNILQKSFLMELMRYFYKISPELFNKADFGATVLQLN